MTLPPWLGVEVRNVWDLYNMPIISIFIIDVPNKTYYQSGI